MSANDKDLPEPPNQNPDPDEPLPQGDTGEGLTDDERVSREDQTGEGARVKLGPADQERLPKK